MSLPIGALSPTNTRTVETARVLTCLGLHFLDVANGAPIEDGLSVVAYVPGAEDRPVAAIRSPSGRYGFHGLPYTQAAEYPLGEDDPPALLQSVVIVVRDAQGRFVPAVFQLPVPPFSGFSLGPGWPPSPTSPPTTSPQTPFMPARAYLFSAATRPAQPGMATIRADLWDVAEDQPAAHAVVRVAVEGAHMVGLSDARGSVLLRLPYPALSRLQVSSPPGAAGRRPDDQRWPVSVQVQYGPSPAARPRLLDERSVPGAERFPPGLKGLFLQQPARLGPAATSTTNPFGVMRELAYGRELCLYSRQDAPETSLGRLEITPATA